MVAFTLRLRKDTYDRLKLIAFLEGKSQSDVVREALEEFLEKYGEVKDPRK